MLIHPALDGIKSVRGAALFIMRCRATLLADANEDGPNSISEAEMIMLLRDNLIDQWGEPARIDALQAVAWLGTEWASIFRVVIKRRNDSEIGTAKEIEADAGSFTRRVMACRAIWQEMDPTPEEREAVKQWMASLAGGWR